MSRLIYHVRVIFACTLKEIQMALADPRPTLLGALRPVLFLVLMSLLAVGGGLAPTAVVMDETGPYARAFYTALAQAHSFQLQVVSAQEAHHLLEAGRIVAVVTIPADFDRRLAQKQPVAVPVQINNLDADFTNDIRRAVPFSITLFYGKAFPQVVTITPHEQDLQRTDTDYLPYLVVSVLVVALMSEGLMKAGEPLAREWENATVKELLLSPVARSALIIGKVLAGFSTAFLMGVVVLTLGEVLGWTRPLGLSLVTSLLILALIALFSTGLGVALGAAFQRTQLVTTTSVLVACVLFFLAGGISVLAFEPIWLQNIAALSPLSYGVHALAQAVFYRSFDQLGRDVLVLSLSSFAALVLGVLMMRRGIAS